MTMADLSLSWKMVHYNKSVLKKCTTLLTYSLAGFIGSAAMNFFNVTLQDGVISNGKVYHYNYLKQKKTSWRQSYNGKTIFGIRQKISRVLKSLSILIQQQQWNQKLLYQNYLVRNNATLIIVSLNSYLSGSWLPQPGRNQSWISIRQTNLTSSTKKLGSYSLE